MPLKISLLAACAFFAYGLTGCEELKSVTVGAYFDCEEKYSGEERTACYDGATHAALSLSRRSFMSSNEDSKVLLREASRTAHRKCNDGFGLFDSRRSACKNGSNFYIKRLQEFAQESTKPKRRPL